LANTHIRTQNAGSNIPFSKQVKYFGATKSQMVAERGSSAAVDRLLAKSVFLICVGSNDLFVFAQSLNQSAADVDTLYRSLVSNYSATIQVNTNTTQSTLWFSFSTSF
jgi:tRNA A-37 threonylcarbamoyl transferase component Bud32